MFHREKTFYLQELISIVVCLALLLGSAGCAAVQPSPTSTSTVMPSPSPTLKPTASPTPIPDLHEGPFTWAGETVPLLMAHYMPWYQAPPVSGSWGWHWTMDHFSPSQAADGAWQNLASQYTPLTGPYDSSDEAVLEYQVALMKLSGIDGVIVDWYGIESFWDYGLINASTARLIQVVKKAGLKFAICYEDQTIKHMVENGHLQKEDAIVHGQKVMQYLQDTWFSDEAYLSEDGRPVLFIFGPQYFKTGDDWEAIFSVLDPKPVFVTLDNRTVPQATTSFLWPPMWASQAGILSHDVLLNYLTSFYDKVKTWEYVVAGAFPGFHDIYKEAAVGSSYGYLDALDGKTFRFTLQEALNVKSDVIQLITWNDYGEGTMIEPTLEFEYRYLEMVQEARQVTSGGDFKYTAEDLRLPFELYQLRLKYVQDAQVTARLDEAFEALASDRIENAREIIASYR